MQNFVERDGSGDFAVIQSALNAAAEGDTIRVGSGRFDESEIYDTIDGHYRIYCNVEQSGLTIVGSGVGETIVGPEQLVDIEELSAVFWTRGAGDVQIEGFTLENALHGVNWAGGHLRLFSSSISTYRVGFGATLRNGGIVEDCVFAGSDYFFYFGIATRPETEGLEIRSCQFQGLGYGDGMHFESSVGVTIANCSVSNFRVGVFPSGSSEMLCRDVSLTQCSNWAMAITIGTSAQLERVSIDASNRRALTSYSGSDIRIADSQFRCYDSPLIDLSGVSIEVRGSNLVKGGALAVEAYQHPTNPPYVLDIRENYWGTSDPDSVAAWIIDGNDEDGLNVADVIFEPISPVPLPVEKKSLSDVKSLYRR